MLSPLPGVIAWPVIGYAMVLIAGRLLLFRDTIADQFLNRIFVWCLLSLLLFRCTWTPGITSLAQLLALGCLVIMSMYILGLAQFWDADSDVAAIWRRQGIYSHVAVVAAVAILVAGTHARAAEGSVDFGLGLQGMVLGIAFGVPMAVCASTLMCAGLRELRRSELATERIFCFAQIACCAFILTNQAVSTTQALTGWPDLGPQLPRVEFITVVCFVISITFAAVPLGTWLIKSGGLDRSGRSCRRLQPLWRDLTAAVPEIVLSSDTDAPARTMPDTRLLRMTVEIRDALLHLRPYFPEGLDGSSTKRDLSHSAVADYAHRLAHAVEARKAGGPPTSSEVIPQLPSAAQNFDTDLRYLLDLAQVWPRARAAIAGDEPIKSAGACANPRL
ncbi:MAB_1171c family putative transporter [Nocardia sp. NPDC047654]|uniref:MAB_1171c family putative transporter n=1 Tax=Nocardia sp. NPDC047654 TaxID=3364314 RepID=UPI0037174CF1